MEAMWGQVTWGTRMRVVRCLVSGVAVALVATLLVGFTGVAASAAPARPAPSAHVAQPVQLARVATPTRPSHKPLFKSGDISTPGRALTIPDPAVSWAVYASLDHVGEVDYYTFQAKASFPLYAQITIPAINGLQQYGPTLALIGPGLPAPTGATPFTPPSGGGVYIQPTANLGTADAFYEPFTQTNYWNRQTLQHSLPASGTYYLAVYTGASAGVKIGKYVLAVGQREEFGFSDLLAFPGEYIHVRQFAEVGFPAWFWVALVVLLALVALIVWRIAVRRRRRSRTSAPAQRAPAKQWPPVSASS